MQQSRLANAVKYITHLETVDWYEMKRALVADSFDNGRTPTQLQTCFENSYAVVIAYADDRIIGTARALSDGVCNAYVVDVWTLTAYRKQGVGTTMLKRLLTQLEGQHIYLFTDDAVKFYEKLGFKPQAIGMGRVMGQWLQAEL